VEPFETKEECQKVCGAALPLQISEVTSLAKKHLPYALVSLEYPKSWSRPEFTVQVNGAEVPFRPAGGGFSTDRQYATLLVFPGGGDTLRLTVQAVNEGQTAEATAVLRWNVWSMAGLLDGPGRLEAVWKPRPVRFWAFPADGVRARWNGRSVSPRLDPLSGKPVGLFTFDPDWQAGENMLAIETAGKDGTRFLREYSFMYLPDGTIPVGEALAIPYGAPGSKSGPFYTVELGGSALAPAGDGEEPYIVIDPDGWAVERTALVKTLRAERPGEVRVRIFVKRHFLQARELERELGIRVVPRAGR
jgi:hypothetical protein